MHKKDLVQVVGNSLYIKQPSKNSTIINPITGTPVFGVFPEIIKHGFPSGNIYLRYGAHMGKNKGFGLIHIWEEHFKQYASVQEAEPHILSLINSILQNGEIFFEMGNKNLIFKKNAGVLILKLMPDGKNNPYYSIITSFPKGKAHGFKIGQMS